MLCRPFHLLALVFLAVVVDGQAELRALVPDPANEAEFQVTRWTTEKGLPQNTVRYLLQSHEGYLWIGTSYGLARYDGMHFKVYVSELAMGPSGDTRVWDLFEDGEQRLWVRTGDGLAAFYGGRWERFPTASPPINGPILTCCASHCGGLWLAMLDGIKRFEHGQVSAEYGTKQGLAQDKAGLLREDPVGRLWVGLPQWNTQMVWQRLDPRTGEVADLTNLVGPIEEQPSNLLPDAQGRVWFWNAHYLKCWAGGHLQSYSPPPEWADPAGTAPTQASQDQAGALYFINGSPGRVMRFLDGTFQTLGGAPGETLGTDLRSVLAGREGGIWIGTGSEGLICLQKRCFSSLLTTESSGSGNEVYAIVPGSQGRVWFGTAHGLAVLEQGSFRSFTNDLPMPPTSFIQQSLRAVLEDRSGTVWFGLHGQGLNRLDQGRFVHESAADLRPTNAWTVTALLESPDGTLWIGSDQGLLRRGGDGRYGRGPGELGQANARVSGLQSAPDGSLWIGTLDTGLYHLVGDDLSRLTAKNGLLSDGATPLVVESDGTCWAGTANGLNRIRGRQVRAVTVEQGLFDNLVYCLLDDGRGYYWASCNRGIWRVSRTDLHRVADGLTNWLECASFGAADGLASTEANGECQPNAARAADGRLWFSTTRGAAVIDPNSSSLNSLPPPVVIEEVLADDQVIFKDGSPAGAFSQGPAGATVRLLPGRARVLEVRYTANSFVNPEKVRFRHRLVGYDPQWRNAGDRRVAFYTNLRPRSYRFEVNACNSQGAWSSEAASFGFSLAPHFWETWTFMVCCGAGAVGLAAGIQAYRLRWQRRVLQLQHQHALADERARIARDLHDDLGTALSGAALELDVMRRDEQAPRVLSQGLEGSAARIRSLAGRMREVVWAVNPHCDSVSSLASFLEQQAAQFLKADGLRCRLEFPEDLPALPLEGDTRHQLALAVREALSNVVRHAEASQVILSMIVDPETLVIRVQDNGRGFRPSESQQAGHGLSNLRMRMTRVGGNCLYISAPGAGTSIEFRVPLERSRRSARPIL